MTINVIPMTTLLLKSSTTMVFIEYCSYYWGEELHFENEIAAFHILHELVVLSLLLQGGELCSKFRRA